MMTSSKPYLIRAFYDWITDNQLTPYIVVKANVFGCQVPIEYVKEGQIILNIAGHVVHGLSLGNDAVEFKARFSGVPRQIYAPMPAIVAIYAKENGQGMAFPEENFNGDGDNSEVPSAPKRGKPDLKIVK